jgi:hypothetical protein
MHDDYVASLADWIAILSISTRLIFEKVRERAIKEITARLDEVEAFDLIGLAIKFDVDQWLKPAYRRIVSRVNLITHAEAVKVPFPMAVMLMRSREQYWRNNRNNLPAHIYGHGGHGAMITNPTTSPDPIIDAEIRLMVLESAETPNGRREPMAMAHTRAA